MTHDAHLESTRSDGIAFSIRADASHDHRIEGDEERVLLAARAAGFCLVQRETDTGLLVWEWRRGNEARPQFVMRRVALHWMSEFLGLDTSTPFVSRDGVGSIANA
jgi:hypothetical protein